VIRQTFEGAPHLSWNSAQPYSDRGPTARGKTAFVPIPRRSTISFLGKLKTLAGQAGQEGQALWSRFNNGPFADATMAACALLGAADGKIDHRERTRTAQFITSSDQLRAFDVSALRQKYEHYCDKITSDFDFGRIELMQAIGRVAGKPDQARAVVQLSVVIANADGEFTPDERRVVREVAQALKLDPNEFGV
jgi:tellurite resistance protein TerB